MHTIERNKFYDVENKQQEIYMKLIIYCFENILLNKEIFKKNYCKINTILR